MALSDSLREQTKIRKNRPVDTTKNLRWSDQQKIDAAKSWLVLGNMAMVSRLHGIPRVTLTKWQETEWWHTLVNDLRMEEKIQLSSKMKNLVEAAHAVVQNRLEQGDAQVLKDGRIVFKPVSMRDAHRVAVDMLNQKQTLEKATAGPEIKEAEGGQLALLAEKFAEFATKSIQKRIDVNRTVDVEDAHVVETKMAHDEPVSDRILLDHEPSPVEDVGEENQEQASGS